MSAGAMRGAAAACFHEDKGHLCMRACSKSASWSLASGG